MARELEGVEIGIFVTDENSDDGIATGLSGAGAPPGTTGKSADAPIGSDWRDRTTGDLYIKIADTNQASDWQNVSTLSISNLRWRNEKVRFATDDTLAAGNVDISALTDNDDMVIGDINVGEFCLGDCDGTPALFEITDKPGGNNITIAAAAQAIADNDTFLVQQFLPDSSGQEVQAIIHFPTAGSPCVKVADVNWGLADGISLNGLADDNGPVIGTDTVQVAIEKLEGDAKDSHQALGISRGDTDMGTYSGDIISDNVAQTVINQELESAIEALGVQKNGTVAQATPTNVDSVLVDQIQTVTWIIVARDTSNANRVKRMEVQALHDGHAGADAATSKESVNEKMNIGNVNVQINTVLTGAGAAQAMNLELNTSEAGGITYTIQRIDALGLAG